VDGATQGGRDRGRARGLGVPIEEVIQLYNLSVDEFLARERDIDRHGCSRPARHALSNLPRYRCAASVGRIMDRAHKLTEKLALTMLARDGIAAIWQLQLASAEAHRSGLSERCGLHLGDS
jgi:hypothetical protein